MQACQKYHHILLGTVHTVPYKVQNNKSMNSKSMKALQSDLLMKALQPDQLMKALQQDLLMKALQQDLLVKMIQQNL